MAEANPASQAPDKPEKSRFQALSAMAKHLVSRSLAID
jgi:hypothetical protein